MLSTRNILCFLFCRVASSWHAAPSTSLASASRRTTSRAAAAAAPVGDGGGSVSLHGSKRDRHDDSLLFDNFCTFLIQQQSEIIGQLEEMEASSGAKFTKDCWGKFETNGTATTNTTTTTTAPESSTLSPLASGGITRVLQGGDVIEKGACSLTIIERGTLSRERAAAIQSRQHINSNSDSDSDNDKNKVCNEGDVYSAAALSIVLHSRSPLIPTFRSDVRIFVVTSAAAVDTDTTTKTKNTVSAWFGGGADLTPYYLNDDDITQFHTAYQTLANSHDLGDDEYTYNHMKKACDDYFYLPARSEHRGSGGIFFDDLMASPESLAFVKGVAKAWMPSWKPIVDKHRNAAYTEQQRQWQLLRRGRYLEFNLLYDRGVKFGLATANPRVEGVMVSAPPLIAWEYNHVIKPDSPEAKLMDVLRTPRTWV